MPKTAAQARPADLKRTVRRLLSYMGHAKFSLLAVGMLASVAAIASLAGTYMVRPIVNGLATGGEELLTKQVIVTAIIYAAGVLSALGYSQIMVRAAQRVVSDIRRDLFAHIQTLPLSYFDSTRLGDIMSFFTNDVDTVSEALNNSFANVIQASIQVIGTTAMLIILNWQLTIITLVCDAAIVLYARYSGIRSKRFLPPSRHRSATWMDMSRRWSRAKRSSRSSTTSRPTWQVLTRATRSCAAPVAPRRPTPTRWCP